MGTGGRMFCDNVYGKGKFEFDGLILCTVVVSLDRGIILSIRMQSVR